MSDAPAGLFRDHGRQPVGYTEFVSPPELENPCLMATRGMEGRAQPLQCDRASLMAATQGMVKIEPIHVEGCKYRD